MAPALHLLWALLVYLPGTLAAPVVTQTAVCGPFSAGQTVRLECWMRNGNVASYSMYWYRQRPGESLEWLIGHGTNNDIYRENRFTDRFQPSRDTPSNSHILTIGSLEPRDSAVYYCAAWDSGCIFGQGTILDIKSSESRKPCVILLPPSPNETDSGSATLSCLVSGFKPGLVALRWSEDGVETENGVTTGAVTPDTDQTFRLSSYLRVSAATWNKGSSYSCSVSHSSLSSPLRNTISSCACAH